MVFINGSEEGGDDQFTAGSFGGKNINIFLIKLEVFDQGLGNGNIVPFDKCFFTIFHYI